MTGGGIHPVAQRIADLTGGEAFDGFKSNAPFDKIAAVIDCGGTARVGVYPMKKVPTVDVHATSPAGPWPCSSRRTSSSPASARTTSRRSEVPPPRTRYATTVTAVGEQVAEFVGQGLLIWFAEGAPEELHFFTVLHRPTVTTGGVRPATSSASTTRRSGSPRSARWPTTTWSTSATWT